MCILFYFAGQLFDDLESFEAEFQERDGCILEMELDEDCTRFLRMALQSMFWVKMTDQVLQRVREAGGKLPVVYSEFMRMKSELLPFSKFQEEVGDMITSSEFKEWIGWYLRNDLFSKTVENISERKKFLQQMSYVSKLERAVSARQERMEELRLMQERFQRFHLKVMENKDLVISDLKMQYLEQKRLVDGMGDMMMELKKSKERVEELERHVSQLEFSIDNEFIPIELFQSVLIEWRQVVVHQTQPNVSLFNDSAEMQFGNQSVIIGDVTSPSPRTTLRSRAIDELTRNCSSSRSRVASAAVSSWSAGVSARYINV